VAYEELLRSVRSVLFHYFARRSSNSASADDLVQETLLALHRVRHTYLPDRSFRTWLFAIARNKAIDNVRAGRARVALADDQDLDCVAGSNGVTSPSAVHAAFASFSLKQRLVLLCHKVRGHSVKETAEQLGITASDVKVNVHRAQRLLKDELDV
jgi:RNA polymerase sigma-70 factor (ECF subfamily)